MSQTIVYLRTSTDKQDLNNHFAELERDLISLRTKEG
jgi:DNA invertase Pin-like site-specific DNA recombinase